MPRHYCTTFDRNYLLQGLTLWRSLRAVDADAVLWVLALDEVAATVLSDLREPNLKVVRVHDLEATYPGLSAARSSRSPVEFIFTLTPFLPRWLLQQHSAIEVLVQVDADMAFFADPSAIVTELGDGSVLLVEHGFPPHLQWMEERGRFNVGVQAYRNDAAAKACLWWWCERCLEWCFDRVEPGRYADQGYLTEMVDRFAGVRVCRHPGINLAPWNWMTHRYAFSPERLLVDGHPLVVFHFARFHPLGGRRFASGQIEYGIMGLRLRTWLYERYIQGWEAVAAAHPAVIAKPVARDQQTAWRQALMHGVLGSTWYRVGGIWFSWRGGLGRWSAHLLGWWRGRRKGLAA